MAGAGVGSSRIEDAFAAGREAGAQARERAGGTPSFVLVYGTVIYDQERLLAGVRQGVGEEVPLVGCSTQGISRNAPFDYVVQARRIGACGVQAALKQR